MQQKKKNFSGNWMTFGKLYVSRNTSTRIRESTISFIDSSLCILYRALLIVPVTEGGTAESAPPLFRSPLYHRTLQRSAPERGESPLLLPTGSGSLVHFLPFLNGIDPFLAGHLSEPKCHEQ